MLSSRTIACRNHSSKSYGVCTRVHTTKIPPTTYKCSVMLPLTMCLFCWDLLPSHMVMTMVYLTFLPLSKPRLKVSFPKRRFKLNLHAGIDLLVILFRGR